MWPTSIQAWAIMDHKFECEKSSRQLWSSTDALLGRGATLPNDKIDAEQFHQYFYEEVTGVVNYP